MTPRLRPTRRTERSSKAKQPARARQAKPTRQTRAAGLTAALLAAALSSGCATRPEVLLPDLSAWEARSAYLADASDWELTGRIGVRAGDDGFNGKLRWRQDGDTFIASVGGPLGIGTVRIAGDADAVVVTDKDGERALLSDVEDDLLLHYGWTIPVTSLRYWALGIPDPAAPVESAVFEEGRLARLEQRDWLVTVTHYRDSAGQPMPYRLSVASAATRVRIVVDDWRFHD